MKIIFLLLTVPMVVLSPTLASGQNRERYIHDIYSESDIVVDKDIIYAENIDFLYSDLSDSAAMVSESADLKQNLASIPEVYYDYLDTATHLKVTRLSMDVYRPNDIVDHERARPMIIYLHDGNFLPKVLNGLCLGNRHDSFAVAFCKKMAQKGYVVVAIDYRLGWNPVSSSETIKKLTFVHAMYRAMHDTKMCVRYLRADARSGNTFGIDPDKITLFGDGTGAFVTGHYAVLDKWEEFNSLGSQIVLSPGAYVIDTLTLGNLNGVGGMLNLYDDTSNASVQAVAVANGVLLDTAWIEAGDPPFLAFHTLFSPYTEFERRGPQIIPDEVFFHYAGPNLFMPVMNASGNNDSFRSSTFTDPSYSVPARKYYGEAFDDCRYSPDRTLKVTSNGENLYPFYIPCDSNGYYFNDGAPWQWWDSTDLSCGRPALPKKSASIGRRYLDTVAYYMAPRLACLFQYSCKGYVSIEKHNDLPDVIVSPNPTSGMVTLTFGSNSSDLEISVIDPIGRRVRSIRAEPNQELRIALGEAKGVYIVLVRDRDGRSRVVKVVRM